MLADQSRQNQYVNHKVRDIVFKVGEHVLLKVSPMKEVMGFCKKGKVIPWYIGPFYIFEDVGPVACKLVLHRGCRDSIQYFKFPCLKGT